MKSNTQKLIVENLLSSNDVFVRCISILSPAYFDPEVRPLIKFIVNYYDKYHAIPKLEYLNSEFETTLKARTLDRVEQKFTLDEIERFCQESALYNAIGDSMKDIASGDRSQFGKVLERVQDALSISIQKELGIDMFADTENTLQRLTTSAIYEATGIKILDEALGGGLARRQVTMFSANSGGGKSLMMSNIGANYARRGFNVLQLALELTEDMIYLRNISILTGIKTTEWKENIAEISGVIAQHKAAGAGSFIVKRIPGGSNANTIRAYLKQYEMEFGYAPDVLIVDYLDLMSPNGGTANKGIFEQDKEKSEQLAEIAFDYDAIVLTASQQNRDGVRTASPDQAIIAGGISKINTVDNYISIYMNPEMRLKGELFLYYLKTRSSSAVGSVSHLAFNPDNLIMSDARVNTVSIINSIINRTRKQEEKIMLPGLDGNEVEMPEDMLDSIVNYYDSEPKLIIVEEPPAPIDVTDDTELWQKNKPKFKVQQSSEDKQDLLDLMTIM